MSRSFKVILANVLVILMLVMFSFGPSSGDEEYPTRPVTMINPTSPGGGLDITARYLGEFFLESLGQPLVVTYKTGGGMLPGGYAVASAKPDGYTLGIFMLPPAIPEAYRAIREAPYSSSDLRPICKVATFVGLLVVKADSPWKTLGDLVEHMKKNPGTKFGCLSKTGSPYLLMSQVAKRENISFKEVPHEGDAKVVISILGGHIPCAIIVYSAAVAQIQSGTIRALAAYSEKRFETLPDVPTFAELGYTPAQYPCFGLFGPKGISDTVVKKVSGVVKRASEDTSYIKKINNLGYQVAFEGGEPFQDALNRYKVSIEQQLKDLGFVKK